MRLMVPWRMELQGRTAAPWWMELRFPGRAESRFRMAGSGRTMAPWEMRVQGHMVPFRMEFLTPGRVEAPWSMRIQSLDEVGVLGFHAQAAGGERYPLFDAPTVSLGAGGESVATFTSDRKATPGAMIYLVATAEAEETAIPLYRGVVAACVYDAAKETYSVTLRDPIGARIGQRVPTKSGAPLEVLGAIARQAGEALVVGDLPTRDLGTLADTDGTVPWLEYVQAIEALAGGVLTWTPDGYSLEALGRTWEIEDRDCFDFSERAALDGYYNSLALVVDDSWTVPAERKTTVLPFAGGTVTKDAAGDQVYRVVVRVGDEAVSDQGWRYNGRHEVVWEGVATPEGRSERSYVIDGDPRVVRDLLEVSGRRTFKEGDPPLRSWDKEVNTSIRSEAAGEHDSVVVTRKTVTRTWEQVKGGTASPEEAYPWTWPEGAAGSGTPTGGGG